MENEEKQFEVKFVETNAPQNAETGGKIKLEKRTAYWVLVSGFPVEAGLCLLH
jgi:hypothetical protein